MMNYVYDGTTFGWGFGGMMMIIIWAAIVLFVIWVVREIGGNNHPDKIPSSKSALDILKERYAKGEIDKKEFEEKKKDVA